MEPITAAIGLGIAGLASGAFNTGYNIWTNQRDFDYQKELQNKIFEREDNAVQRRMSDLKAAGLNPNLAAGSAAGAGSVVGRSNTPSLSGNSVGTALDVAQHLMQLRNEREQNKVLKNQQKLLDAQTDSKELENVYSRAELYYLLGMNPSIEYDFSDKPFTFRIDGSRKSLPDTPLGQQLLWQFQNQKNSADLLQRDVDWYTADKIQSYVNTAGSLFSHGASGYNSIMSGNRFNRSRR